MVRSRTSLRYSGGFSFLYLSIALIGLGFALTVVFALLPNKADQTRIDKTLDTMWDAQDNVLAFVVENYRLPEPDIDANGVATFASENAGEVSGSIPYRSMDLPEAVLDEASLPLRYTPYRNTTDSADLASATSLYTPTLPTPGDFGCPAIPASPVNLLDFCVALENAESAAASAAFANTGPGTNNAAYVLVSGGLEDADGDQADSSLDGLNDDGDVSYDDPARGRQKGYDDIVRSVPFASLQRALSCSSLTGSVDLLAIAADDAKNVSGNIKTQKFQADVLATLLAFAEVVRGIALANTIVSATGIAANTTVACGLAAACLGICVNITAACAALSAATVSATAAAVAAGVDLVIGAIEVGLAIDNAVKVAALNTAAQQHVCDVINDVTAADVRGGLL